MDVLCNHSSSLLQIFWILEVVEIPQGPVDHHPTLLPVAHTRGEEIHPISISPSVMVTVCRVAPDEFSPAEIASRLSG
jgi:hypothetical protein